MAERTTAKTKRQATRPGAPKTATAKAAAKRAISKAAPPLASGDDGPLRTENDRLRSELATAHQRIAELERKQTDIANRIAWVVDSLHNLAD